MASVKAVALITGDDNVKGSVQFLQHPEGVIFVKGTICGLKPGLHGFHIHALGDTTNGCISTGPHYNPLKQPHGAPFDTQRHAGDLGNIVAGPDGVAHISIEDRQIPLTGQHSILGRAVVVHADPDDLGKGTCSYYGAVCLLRLDGIIPSSLVKNIRVDMSSARQLAMLAQELAVVSLDFSHPSKPICRKHKFFYINRNPHPHVLVWPGDPRTLSIKSVRANPCKMLKRQKN